MEIEGYPISFHINKYLIIYCIGGEVMSDLNRRAAEAMGWVSERRYSVFIAEKIRRENARGIASSAQPYEYTYQNGIKVSDFDPCNRIDHAWMLVEWLVERNRRTKVNLTFQHNQVRCDLSIQDSQELLTKYYYAIEKSAPLAITRAFLEAVGGAE